MAQVKSDVSDEPANSFTSMIDIVFLLLIFFILQPFKAPEMKLRSELPKDSGQAASPQTPRPNITLRIQKIPGSEGKANFMINTDMIGRDGSTIWEKLLREANGDRTVAVVIDADPGVHFDYVLTALDQCYKAQMQDVKFASPPAG